MSIPVDLAALRTEIARFGARALLITSSNDDPPHVASVLVTLDENGLSTHGGRRTRANIAARPHVTVVWPTGPDDSDYCLIVDGTAQTSQDSETLLIRPISAILHRLAGADATLPS